MRNNMENWKFYVGVVVILNCIATVIAGWETVDAEGSDRYGTIIFAFLFGALVLPMLTLGNIGAFLKKRYGSNDGSADE